MKSIYKLLKNRKSTIEGNAVTLQIEGISAHGSTPEKGENAGLLLANFLTTVSLDGKATAFATFATETFTGDIFVKKLLLLIKMKLAVR